MSRQVFTRNVRHDAIKAAITFGMIGDSDPDNRAWAVKRWGTDGAPTEINKAADAATVTYLDSASSTGILDRELFRAVRERALLFRIRGFRRTGFRIRSTTISNATGTFVGEGKPIPVLKPTVTNVGLAPAKVAGMSVWTKEALESTPGIEQLVFDDLVQACSNALDFAMFDVSNDGTDIAPASLTNANPPSETSGSIEADIAQMIEQFGGDLASAVFVTTPQVAAWLGLELVLRDVGARGGELVGVPVLTSSALPAGQITLVDPASIMVAWDEQEQWELQTSEHGDCEMLTDSLQQDQPTGAQLVGLWMNNLIAIRAIGRVAWKAAGPSAARSVSGLLGHTAWS